MNQKDWDFVNRRLAKMLSEMEYEQVFHAESQGDDHYCINLPGAQWRFIAERGIWGWLWIDAQTLRCTDEPVLAQTLLMQLKPVLSMSDATVAEHMQDLYATLLGDLQLLKARRGLSASDLINLDADRLQCLLSGHPKFVFNKGRRGWGKEALERYAPEYTNTFRLHWLAVKREHMIWRCDNDLDIQQLLTAAMDPQESSGMRHFMHGSRKTGWITTGCRCRYIRGSGSKKSPQTSSLILPKAGWCLSASLATSGSPSSRCVP